MKSKIKVRKYKESDCAALAGLFYETVRSVNAKDYSKEQLCAWAPEETDLSRWGERLRGSFTAVAEYGGITAGFGNINENGYLDMLFVHKDHQSMGIASAICDVIEKYPSANNIYAYASITAKPFFEARGYRTVRENIVEKGGIHLTNYLMEKIICEPHTVFAETQNEGFKQSAGLDGKDNRLVDRIRRFTAADTEYVAEIWLEANKKAHGFISSVYWEDNFKAVKELIPQAEVYVYEHRPNGGDAAEDEPESGRARLKACGIRGFIGLNGNYIEGIFVFGRHRSKGIGKTLLDFAKGKKKTLFLKVYKKNLRAIDFYKREGFIVCGSGTDDKTREEEFYMEWAKEKA